MFFQSNQVWERAGHAATPAINILKNKPQLLSLFLLIKSQAGSTLFDYSPPLTTATTVSWSIFGKYLQVLIMCSGWFCMTYKYLHVAMPSCAKKICVRQKILCWAYMYMYMYIYITLYMYLIIIYIVHVLNCNQCI